MKISIKNYRTVLDSELKINKNQINYLIGSNESGKSNILNSLRILNMEGSSQEEFEIFEEDKTQISNAPVKEEIKLIVSEGESQNEISSKGSASKKWFYVDSGSRREYLGIINKINDKEILDTYKERLSEEEIDHETFAEIKENLEKLKAGKWVNYAQRDQIFEEFTEEQEEISSAVWKMEIDFPKVIYVEPIIKAKENKKTSYPYDNLFNEDSTIRNICRTFLSEEEVETIENLKEQFPDEDKRARIEGQLFDDLNSKLKDYFDKFQNIKAYPIFRPRGSRIVLDVVSKNKWKIDTGDENERSLGYKSFLRILTELIAMKNSDTEVFYLIDEPEQSLHPYLQEELILEVEKILKENTKLTLIVASHSPYIIKISDQNNMNNISLVNRSKDGATKITHLSNSTNIINSYMEWATGNKTEENYLFKIINDSINWRIIDKNAKNKLKELHKEQKSGNMDQKTFLKKSKEIFQIINFLK